MRKIKVQKLTHENFHRYGTFAPLIDPLSEEAAGPKDAESVFFRDLLQQDLGGGIPSYSTCRVLPRPFVITDAEYHNHTCEVAIPLDGDAVLWFAPATPDKEFPADRAEAFFVPRGTVVSVRPGVWHHAAYSLNDKPLNVLIVLPERTYATDAFSIPLPPENRVEIEL